MISTYIYTLCNNDLLKSIRTMVIIKELKEKKIKQKNSLKEFKSQLSYSGLKLKCFFEYSNIDTDIVS